MFFSIMRRYNKVFSNTRLFQKLLVSIMKRIISSICGEVSLWWQCSGCREVCKETFQRIIEEIPIMMFSNCSWFKSLNLLKTLLFQWLWGDLTINATNFSPRCSIASCVQVFLLAICAPVNVLYRSTRMCFLRCFRRVVCAPFYKVATTLCH